MSHPTPDDDDPIEFMELVEANLDEDGIFCPRQRAALLKIARQIDKAAADGSLAGLAAMAMFLATQIDSPDHLESITAAIATRYDHL